MIAAHTTARTPAETIDAATRIEDFLAAWGSRHPDQHTIASATTYARHGQEISVHRAVVTVDDLRNILNARNVNDDELDGNCWVLTAPGWPEEAPTGGPVQHYPSRVDAQAAHLFQVQQYERDHLNIACPATTIAEAFRRIPADLTRLGERCSRRVCAACGRTVHTQPGTDSWCQHCNRPVSPAAQRENGTP